MKKIITTLTALTLCSGVSFAQTDPNQARTGADAGTEGAATSELTEDAQTDRNELTSPAAGTRDTTMADTDTKDRNKPMSAADFVSKATMSHQFEIEAGQLAAEKGQSEEVKEFGEKMASEHEDLKEELHGLATDDDVNIAPPTQLDEKHLEKLTELRDASDAEFDRVYLSQQYKAHQKALKMFRNADNNTQFENMGDYPSDAAEAVEEHLEELREILSGQDIDTAALDTEMETELKADVDADLDTDTNM